VLTCVNVADTGPLCRMKVALGALIHVCCSVMTTLDVVRLPGATGVGLSAVGEPDTAGEPAGTGDTRRDTGHTQVLDIVTLVMEGIET